MLMKSIALVMSLMLLLCGSAASEQLGATNSGGGKWCCFVVRP